MQAALAAPSCRRAGRQHTGHGGPNAGEGWEITETTDPSLLTEYGLHAELARFFATPDEHGEYIGTSGPIDFRRFTLAVKHQTDFTPRKLFAAVGGVELPLYRQDENGQMVPIWLLTK